MVKNDACQQVTAIVPCLPPSVNGVGDYGFQLARELRFRFNIGTNFVVCQLNEQLNADPLEGFSARQIARHSPEALLDALPVSENTPNTVLLQYVGYGYAKRGCPVWLVRGLETWRRGGQNRRLVTMFHELYALPNALNSQLITSAFQKRLTVRLIRLSDRCLTNRQDYACSIASLSQGKHDDVPVLPVFSNIGEADTVSPLAMRPRRLVVFGSRIWRDRVYKKSQPILERICQSLEIQEIVDIGNPLASPLNEIARVPVRALGICPPDAVCYWLHHSVAGCLDYPRAFLAKSGIFAAYCSHQVLPALTSQGGKETDGLVAGKHYWSSDCGAERLDLSVAQAIAQTAYDWYCGHRLSVQATAFADRLAG